MLAGMGFLAGLCVVLGLAPMLVVPLLDRVTAPLTGAAISSQVLALDGAVSGADDLYASEEYGNRSFVFSATATTGKTRRMLWCEPGDRPPAVLLPHKERLLARRVRSFDESNWWNWGRAYHQSAQARVYVNGRTRRAQPFFVHPCRAYDGSVLAIFPRDPRVDVHELASALNTVDWADLGFICDGRFLFTQRSLERAPLPESFRAFAAPETKLVDLPRKRPQR
jgi:adenine-specific DNA-methyltransferase